MLRNWNNGDDRRDAGQSDSGSGQESGAGGASRRKPVLEPDRRQPQKFAGGGEWVKVGSGKCLWGADSSHAAGTEIAAGLPNIEATVSRTNTDSGVIDQKRAVTTTGAFTVLETGSNSYSGTSSYASGAIPAKFGFDASLSNSIYGNSTTVQPPALAVNIWKRTS